MKGMLARVGAGAAATAAAGVAYAAYRFVFLWMECRDGKDWYLPQSLAESLAESILGLVCSVDRS